MTPVDYVKKYDLKESEKFAHNDFIEDLKNDFIEIKDWFLSGSDSQKTAKNFFGAVDDIKQRFNDIFLFASRQAPEKLWNFFYATVIVQDGIQLGFMEDKNKGKIKRREIRSPH